VLVDVAVMHVIGGVAEMFVIAATPVLSSLNLRLAWCSISHQHHQRLRVCIHPST